MFRPSVQLGIGLPALVCCEAALPIGGLPFAIGNPLGAINLLRIAVLAHLDGVLLVKVRRLLVEVGCPVVCLRRPFMCAHRPAVPARIVRLAPH